MGRKKIILICIGLSVFLSVVLIIKYYFADHVFIFHNKEVVIIESEDLGVVIMEKHSSRAIYKITECSMMGDDFYIRVAGVTVEYEDTLMVISPQLTTIIECAELPGNTRNIKVYELYKRFGSVMYR